MSKQYYIQIQGAVSGPYTGSQIQRLAAQGQLPKTASLSTDRVRWIPADKVPGLRSGEPSASAGPLPPTEVSGRHAVPHAPALEAFPPAGARSLPLAKPSQRSAHRRCDVFLSYRRQGGSEIGRVVAEMLRRMGYHVFIDVDELGAGDWTVELEQRIDEGPDFVPIITPGFFDRCSEPNDVVRKELACAPAQKKNVVPLIAADQPFPATLPEDIASISRFNGVRYVHEYAAEAVEKLSSMLLSRVTGPERLYSGEAQPRVVVAIVAMLCGAWQGSAMGLLAGRGPLGSYWGISHAFTNGLFWGVFVAIACGVPLFILLSFLAARLRIRGDELYTGPWIPFWALFVPLTILFSSVLITGLFSLLAVQSYFWGGISGQFVSVGFLATVVVTKAWTPIGEMIALIKRNERSQTR